MMFITRIPFLMLLLVPFLQQAKNNDDYQAFVDKVTSFQEKVTFVSGGMGQTLDTAKFKLKEYYSLFDKIKMEKGWKLQFFYHYDGMGGWPLFIAIRENQSFENIFKDNTDSRAVRRYADSIPVTDHMIIDPSAMGYFQYLVFLLKGSNFALHWHSGYEHMDLLCSEKAMNELASQENDFIRFTKEEKSKLKKLDPRPVFEETADTCYVQLHYFNPWLGVTKRKYAISRKFPHRLKYGQEEVLMKYSCGIRF